MAYYRRRGCTCPKDPKTKKVKRCSCGAKWSYTIDLDPDPVTGERRQKTEGGFSTKDEAIEAASQVYVDRKGGTYVQRSSMLFKDWRAIWLEKYKLSGVKLSTIRLREDSLHHLSNTLDHMKLKDITTEKYQTILDGMKKEDYSRSHISSVHAIGNMIFNYAVEQGKLKNSPAKSAKMPEFLTTVAELEQSHEIPRYLEKEELALFLKTAEKRGIGIDYEVFYILAHTGLRIGEFCNLKDIDMQFDKEGGRFSVRRTYFRDRKEHKHMSMTPKTKASVRTVEFEEDVAEKFKKVARRLNLIKMRHRDIFADQGFLFVTEGKHTAKNPRITGDPLTPHAVQDRMKRLLKLSGLSMKFSPHIFRHTHVSLLAEAGASLDEIMERLGHGDDNTTRKIYQHITKARKKMASKKFSELMKSITQ